MRSILSLALAIFIYTNVVQPVNAFLARTGILDALVIPTEVTHITIDGKVCDWDDIHLDLDLECLSDERRKALDTEE